MDLTGCVQNYAWGKLGQNSAVATLYRSNDCNCVVDQKTPYAELWMGTHPNCPTLIKESGKKLGDWILDHENCLGDGVINTFGKELPFLFKVLSVNKALSIQAHPAKSHAEQLHSSFPDIYKDPNHKPELAIALTEFEALCGFRPIEEIKQFIEDIPQLRALLGEKNVAALLNNTCDAKTALKDCFHHLMTSPKDAVEKQLESLIALGGSGDTSKKILGSLLNKLYSEFPGDVGCFCIYFLNYLKLQPGESIYLAANEIHAYLSGDCVECMACSDNVVRAGLTPKYRDVEILCNMLSYTFAPASANMFQPVREDAFTNLFQPELPDFGVANIVIPCGTDSYDLIPRKSASIILVVGGEGESNHGELKLGTIKFLQAGENCNIKSISVLNIFQAFANV